MLGMRLFKFYLGAYSLLRRLMGARNPSAELVYAANLSGGWNPFEGTKRLPGMKKNRDSQPYASLRRCSDIFFVNPNDL
jgi:hypothetical protein